MQRRPAPCDPPQSALDIGLPRLATLLLLGAPGHEAAAPYGGTFHRKFLGAGFPEIVPDHIGDFLGLHDPII
jgi:hypothetical protein